MPALRTRDTPTLEVTTTPAPPPPSLTIISPTPRAFTFPITHNLADSPYSSPSNSPFEPDLRALALTSSCASSSSSIDECQTPPPLSAFTRTLSPAIASSASSAPTSPAGGPVRRKSTSGASGAGEERRPKKGDDDYVKRPENAFILFRRKCCEDRALGISSAPSSAPSSLAAGPSSADSPALASGKKQRQADLSKTISQQWKALSAEERGHWEELAKQKKKEHEALHPNYVYRPQRVNKNRTSTSPSSSSSAAGKRKNSAPAPPPALPPPGAQDIEFVVPRAQHGRSSSAPTPPPYQSIQIPNVYFGAASTASPESPTSLMPMISRRGVGNGQGGFDYMPSFAGAFDFEASLQSSDFLRSMFPNPSMMSPASSASGSGPSSPHTPASASFHPSTFASAPYVGGAPTDFSLDGPAPVPELPVEDYAAYASAWAAASPWATAPAAASVLAEGDFDIARIPELGWDLSCGAAAQQQCDDVVGELAYPMDFGVDMEGGAGEDGGSAVGENGLDLHFGSNAGDELSMGDMGFDEMMAGAGF